MKGGGRTAFAAPWPMRGPCRFLRSTFRSGTEPPAPLKEAGDHLGGSGKGTDSWMRFQVLQVVDGSGRQTGFLYEMRFRQAFCPVFRQPLEAKGRDPRQNRAVENLAHLIIQDPGSGERKSVPLPAVRRVPPAAPSGVPTLEILWKRGPSSAYLGLSPVPRRPFSFPTRAWWIRSCAPVRFVPETALER